ncbi:MAG: DUF3303 family protein [Pseudomonadota bacterium]
MRLMLKFTIPVAKGNAAAAQGTIDKAIEALVAQVKPEAAYFFLENGKRAGLVVFEATDQTQMPAINEPLFAALDAAIEIQPVMNLEDLERGLHVSA